MPDTAAAILSDYMPKAQFASELGCHERTIDNYRSQPNGLPSLTIGGKVYIPIADAREWIARRVARPNPVRNGHAA